MLLRTPRSLSVLALLVPAFVALPATTAQATQPESDRAPAHVVDEWTGPGDSSQLPLDAYARVEVTYDATYGITLDGRIVASVASYLSWSRPTQWANLNAVPTIDRPFVDVTGGTQFGMALDDQGKLHTWGASPSISTEDRALTYRDVAAVGEAALGVTSTGEVKRWGAAASGGEYGFPDGALAGADVVSVDLGSAASLALTSDGRVISGGYALTGSYFEAEEFPASHADDHFVAIDAGVSTAVALTDEGEIVRWGSWQNGEGDVPALPAGRHATAVSAGMHMMAAVLDDGTVVTWGNRESTQLPTLREDVPVADIDLDRYRTGIMYGAIASTSRPVISGTVKFGETLTASSGAWTETPDEVHFQWQSLADGAGSTVGSDSDTYVPSASDADAGATIFVTVTAIKDGRLLATSTSEPTGPVAPKTFESVPTAAVPAKPRVGVVQTATVGNVGTGTPTYQWLRNGVVIPGATARTYRPTAADLSRRLQVRTTLTAPGYATTAPVTSMASAPVALGPAKLAVSRPAKAKLKKTATFTVRGLSNGERVTLTVGSQRTTGKAAANGVATIKLKITGKKGTRAVTAVGAAGDRIGRTTLKVVK